MDYRFLRISDMGSVRHIEISMESPLNPLNMDLIGEIGDVIRSSEGKVVVISGRNRAFSAGADIHGFVDLTPEMAYEFATKGHRVMDSIEEHPLPVIAAMHGFALGGGFELALACDFRIAHPETKMGLPEINLGIIPGFGGTQRLLRIAGEARALQMISTGSTITAKDAVNFGIVNEVNENYRERAFELASELAAKPHSSLKFSKRLLRHHDPEAFELEKEFFGRVFGLPDRREGVSAFLEKRKPQFNREQ